MVVVYFIFFILHVFWVLGGRYHSFQLLNKNHREKQL